MSHLQKTLLAAAAIATLGLFAAGCEKGLAPASYSLDTADMLAKMKKQAEKFPGPADKKEEMMAAMTKAIGAMKFDMILNADGTAEAKTVMPNPMKPEDAKEVDDKGSWTEKEGVLSIKFEQAALAKDGALKCTLVEKTTTISCLPEKMNGEEPLLFKRK